MDIIRNVGVRESIPQGSSKKTDTDINSMAMKLADSKSIRNSFPNIFVKDLEQLQQIGDANNTNTTTTNKVGLTAKVNVHQEVYARSDLVENLSDSKLISRNESKIEGGGDDEEECAISGRLEIRVIQQNLQEQKNSPNPDESIYFDALANGQTAIGALATPDEAKTQRKLLNRIFASSNDRNQLVSSSGASTALSNESADGKCGEIQSGGEAPSIANIRKYFIADDNTTVGGANIPATTITTLTTNECNNSSSNPNSAGDGDNRASGMIATNVDSINDDNAADTFVSAATTLAKLSNVMEANDANALSATNAMLLCNANDTLSTNDNNKEFPVVSYSLYPNQTSTIEQTTNKLTPTTTTTATINTSKPISNQSDGTVSSTNVSNQINNKKITTNTTTSTLNNSSNSKIPVLNPNARMMKCASWAGSDIPITPVDMNDLTPGMSCFVYV